MVFVTLKHFLKLVVSPSELTKWHSLMCLTVKHAAVQRYHLLQKCFSVNWKGGKTQLCADAWMFHSSVCLMVVGFGVEDGNNLN